MQLNMLTQIRGNSRVSKLSAVVLCVAAVACGADLREPAVTILIVERSNAVSALAAGGCHICPML
jgi:hypothetical protein